jgi:hypothetical protein
MTRQQFIDNFLVQYDEVADLSAPGFSPTELSIIASKVQEDLVVTKYSPKSNRTQEGFEETEKRIQDLGELVKYKTYSTFSPGFFQNSVEIVLPNTLISVGPTDFSDVYWFTIYEDVISNVLDCTIPDNTTVYVHPKVNDTTHGELIIAQKDPFRKPYIKANEGKVLRVRTEGRKHLLITDGTFTITRYDVGYVRKPQPIVLTSSLTSQVSELSDAFHRELLDATINYCLRLTDQTQKFQVDQSIIKE